MLEKLLFENIEIEDSPMNYIKRQIEFVLNSFVDNKYINDFGINLWKLNIEEIKNILIKEEPRINIYDIKLEQNILIIDLEYLGDRFVFKHGGANEIRRYF